MEPVEDVKPESFEKLKIEPIEEVKLLNSRGEESMSFLKPEIKPGNESLIGYIKHLASTNEIKFEEIYVKDEMQFESVWDDCQDKFSQPMIGVEPQLTGTCKFEAKMEKRKILRAFQCTECSFVFTKKFRLSRHMKSVHDKLKPFKCTICEYACSEKDSLSKHINAVHEKLKPFECYECSFEFSNKSDLSRHIKTVHEKLKPFKCSICKYACTNKPDITKHINSVHEKLKPLKCSFCEFATSRKNSLLRHIKQIHEKLKPL